MSATIPKETFSFLKRLEKNNNRDWFNDNKKEFKAIEAQVKEFYNMIYNNLNVHDDVDKMKMFRIYRDIRFSKDKTPYKIWFAGSFARKKPELRGGYYLRISPHNETFLATGFWEPNKDDLFRIRKEFENDDSTFRKIIGKKSFKDIWGELVGDEVKTAQRALTKNIRLST